MNTNVFDTIFRDQNDDIVIAQPPNLTLSIWMGASLLQLAFTSEPIHRGQEIVAFASLLTWSFAEVNYFRRGLGLVVFLFAMVAGRS